MKESKKQKKIYREFLKSFELQKSDLEYELYVLDSKINKIKEMILCLDLSSR